MVKNKLALVASALLCVGAQNAAANEIGFYMGGYLGQSKKEVPRAPLDDFAVAVHEVAFFTPSDVQSSLDDTDTAFAIFGGYRLNRYLGFEAGFTNLGTVTYKSQATGSFPLEAGRVNTTVESETSGFTLSVLGLLPQTNTLFGFVPLHGNDVWLHAVLALVAAYFGFVHRETTVTTA